MAALAAGQGCQFELGQRVAEASGSAHGTVRYVGTVPTSKKTEAIYVGVEWDSDTRGKHDGSVTTGDGVKHQLFTCRDGCGSFVKPGKISSGISLLEATKERYDPSANLGMDEDKVLSTVENARTGEEVPVMLVGLRHINEKRKMGVISNVCFTGAPIATVGPAGQFAKACPKVESISLVNTLLSDWEEVGRLCGDIPKLRSLDLSSNRLVPFPLPLAAGSALRGAGGPCASVGSSFSNLVSITLNRMLGGAGAGGTGALSWAHVEALASIAPSLKELSLVDNGISSLASAGAAAKGGVGGEGEGECAAIEGFINLTTLVLSINLLSDWSEVWRLRRLPKLEQLHINGNRLRSVRWCGRAAQSESALSAAAAGVFAGTGSGAGNETKVEREDEGAVQAGGECCINPGASAKLYSGDDVVAQALKIQKEKMERKKALVTADTPFPALRILTLANNALESWASVDALNHLVFLDNLRVLQGNSGLRAHLPGVSVHHEAIARLPELSTLDGSPVKARARRDAELIYLRGALYEPLSSGEWDRWEAAMKGRGGGKGAQAEAVPEGFAALLKLHPQIPRLLAIYGLPNVPRAGGAGVGDGAARGGKTTQRVAITVTSYLTSSCTVAPMKKKVPLSLDVRKLRLMCCRKFKEDIDSCRLVYRPAGSRATGSQVDLEDGNALGVYALDDGAELTLEESTRQTAREEEEDALKKRAAEKRELEDRIAELGELRANLSKAEAEEW